MKFTLQFTEDELNLILAVLQEQPYKVSNVLINKIHTEANKQLKDKEDVSPSK